jgi:hypothetical protein
MNNIMENWKTTASALVTAIFGFILFSPEYFEQVPWLVSIAKYFAAGGLIGLGFSAKDSNVTGGTVQQ